MKEELKTVIQNRFNEKMKRAATMMPDMVLNLQNTIEAMKDVIVPQSNPGFSSHEKTTNHLRVEMFDQNYSITNYAVNQLASRYGIPTAYMNSLLQDEKRSELATTILSAHREWTDPDSRFLVRSVDGEIRAVLSDSYKRINSMMILMAFLESIKQCNAQVYGVCQSPTKFYIEAIIPKLMQVETALNGMVYCIFGVRISNSDYGDGSLDIRSFIEQPVCTNGMVRESLIRKVHLGKKYEDETLSLRAYQLESELFAQKTRDITQLALNEKTISDNIAQIKALGSKSINIDREFIRMATKGFTKNDIGEIQSIMLANNPLDGLEGEASAWKLVQAVTAYGRNLGGEKEREFSTLAGDLF